MASVKDRNGREASYDNSQRRAAPNPDTGPKGASAGLQYSGLEAYFGHHRQSAGSSLLRLLRSPFSSLLTWLVIAVALALPMGLTVMLDNVSGLTENLEGSSKITIYMKLTEDDQNALQLSQQIAQRQDVDSVEFISRHEALEEFKELSGWGDVLAYLDNNPLPSVIVVQPAEHVDSAGKVAGLTEKLESLSGVDNVQVDLQWVQRLNALFAVLKRVVIALAALFGVAVILIIGNTIRLAIENRRDEIIVVKLVGGTDPYVRRPFLYTGFWYGFIGAALAWCLVNISLLWIANPVNQLAALYYSRFNLHGLSFADTFLLMLFGGFLGIAGAWIAVKRHLDDIEPQ